ncbi:MAG: DUF4315 family protein [Lachnospiraceae bacterium]|nr:DUF4315 family protein [Lachnospiraceae bacterium]
MPRGKVIKRSLDEQISILEEDIRIAQNKLNKLQTKWKELQKQKKEEDMAELYALIKETGMSVEQVRQVLAGAPQQTIPDAAGGAEPAAESIIDIA